MRSVMRGIRMGAIMNVCLVSAAAISLRWHAADMVMGLLMSSLAVCTFIVVLFGLVSMVAPRQAGASEAEAASAGRYPAAVVVALAQLLVVWVFHALYGAWIVHVFHPAGIPDPAKFHNHIEMASAILGAGALAYWPAIAANLVDSAFQLYRDFGDGHGIWAIRPWVMMLALQLGLPVMLASGYLLPASVLIGPAILLLCLPVEPCLWEKARKFFGEVMR